MKNTLENAQAFVELLDSVNPDWHLHKEALATFFLSYAAKTQEEYQLKLEKNNKTRAILTHFGNELRQWNKELEMYDLKLSLEKPQAFHDFVNAYIEHKL